ncbi:Isopenicillin N synthase [Artemisia annua]|uniref:Isopenicillin N synthase n=1 Tax=Artemisia annua TaxID=35608 RepID=A0A2U1PF43_ARTAN|nr:Isopenicillin N synthase [Artemisia annua]
MIRSIPHIHLHEKIGDKEQWHGAEIQVVIEGNCNVYEVPPAEFKALLLTHPEIYDCAVITSVDYQGSITTMPSPFKTQEWGQVVAARAMKGVAVQRFSYYQCSPTTLFESQFITLSMTFAHCMSELEISVSTTNVCEKPRKVLDVLLEDLAKSLSLDKKSFVQYFEPQQSEIKVRVNYYPPCPRAKQIRSFGFTTLKNNLSRAPSYWTYQEGLNKPKFGSAPAHKCYKASGNTIGCIILNEMARVFDMEAYEAIGFVSSFIIETRNCFTSWDVSVLYFVSISLVKIIFSQSFHLGTPQISWLYAKKESANKQLPKQTMELPHVDEEPKKNYIFFCKMDLLIKGSSFQSCKECSPCILFFDERLIDAATALFESAIDRARWWCVLELDGGDERKGVYIIGATNRYNSARPKHPSKRCPSKSLRLEVHWQETLRGCVTGILTTHRVLLVSAEYHEI